jgi:hypothetical protein
VSVLKRIVVFLIVLLSFCSVVMASQPLMVMDVSDSNSLPQRFRTTNDTVKSDKVMNLSLEGLDELHILGSAQFSAEQLPLVLTQISSKKVTIVDLREECHGYIYGLAVSWYGAHNQANKGKPLEEIVTEEASRLDGIMNSRQAKLIMSFDKQRLSEDKVQDIEVNDVMVESRLAELNHVGYVRLPVTDRMAPGNESIDKFVEFVKKMPPDMWLYFHCRAGHGRTTTFMLLYDILRNGKKLPLADLAERQYLLGGVDLLVSPPKEVSNKYQDYVRRAQLIKLFYEYVKTSPDDLPVPWSEWVKEHDERVGE